MRELASQIIADICRMHMGIVDEKHIWIDDLNYNIPNDADIMLAISSMNDGKVLGSKSWLDSRDDGVYEVSRVELMENITIDVLAKGVEAINRRWEVISALSSIYAQQKQEEHSFKIGRIPNQFLNTSANEGGSRLARFTLSFACLVWYKKETLINPNDKLYFENFGARADTASSVGDEKGNIEFTIDETTEI